MTTAAAARTRHRSGLISLRARAYDPGLGRFTSADSFVNAIKGFLSNPSFAIMFVPVLGEIYSLACAFTGKDLFTGEHLSPGERLLYAVGGLGILGSIGLGMAKIGGKFLSKMSHLASELGSRLSRAFGKLGEVLGGPGAKLKGFLSGVKEALRGDRALGEAERAAGSPMRGVVEFHVFQGASPEQIKQFEEYVRVCNEALDAGALSATGRVSTKGSLARQAQRAAERERLRAAAAGIPYKGVVGHGPDTAWSGKPIPYKWLDFDPHVNSSLGGQVNNYKPGFVPTGFKLVH
jgi:hypothetical protein